MNRRRGKRQLHEHERASHFHGPLELHPTVQDQENRNGGPCMPGLLCLGQRREMRGRWEAYGVVRTLLRLQGNPGELT